MFLFCTAKSQTASKLTAVGIVGAATAADIHSWKYSCYLGFFSRTETLYIHIEWHGMAWHGMSTTTHHRYPQQLPRQKGSFELITIYLSAAAYCCRRWFHPQRDETESGLVWIQSDTDAGVFSRNGVLRYTPDSIIVADPNAAEKPKVGHISRIFVVFCEGGCCVGSKFAPSRELPHPLACTSLYCHLSHLCFAPSYLTNVMFRLSIAI